MKSAVVLSTASVAVALGECRECEHQPLKLDRTAASDQVARQVLPVF
jgi:hypothetical protein